MKYFMTPYDTMANRPYIKQAEQALSIIEEQVASGADTYFATLGKHIRIPKPDNERLTYWTHPITHEGITYIDTRAYLTKDGRVRNTIEHTVLLERAVMEHVWQHDSAIYEGIAGTLATVYAEWVSSGICSRYNATISDRSKFVVVLTCYFLSVIYKRYNHDVVGGSGIKLSDVAFKTLTRYAGLPVDYIEGVMNDMLVYISKDEDGLDLGELAAAMVSMSDIEMGNFDRTVIMQLSGAGSWIGANSTLLAITALENPPTFTVLLKNSVAISTYRNKTRIGRAANAVERKVNLDVVIKTVSSLASDYIPEHGFKNPI